MTLCVTHAEPGDVDRLVDVYFAAFQNPLALVCFPDTPKVRSWWIAELRRDMAEGRGTFVKVTEKRAGAAGSVDEITAFAQWHPPQKPDDEDDEEEQTWDWPEGGDHEVANAFFQQVSARHKEIVGAEEHWCESRSHTPIAALELLTASRDLEIIATAPEHQRKGAASLLLSYACDKADETGHKCYLEASPVSVPVYRKFGFEERGRVAVMINGEEYPNTCMVRESRTVKNEQSQ